MDKKVTPKLIAFVGERKSLLTSAALTVAATAAYGLCSRREVWYSDFASFSTFPEFLAPLHYPGYPFPAHLLYLPHLVANHPFPILSAVNALFAAAAVGIIYWILRTLEVARPVAAVVAAALASTPLYWEWACLGPEVHTLELLTAGLVTALSFTAYKTKDPRFFTIAVFVFSLSLGNRNTFIVLAPLPLLALTRLTRKTRALAAATLALILGLSVYLFIVFRRGAYGDQYGDGSYATASLVFNELFRVKGYSFLRGAEERGQGYFEYVTSHLAFYAKPLPLLLAAGGVAFAIKRKLFGVMTGLVLVTTASLSFYAVYTGTPSSQYLLLPIYFIYVLAGVGADALFRLLNRNRLITVLLGLTLAAWPAYNVATYAPAADHSRDRGVASRVREGFSNIPLGARVVGEHWYLMGYAYAHAVQRRRPDLTLYSVNHGQWPYTREEVYAGTAPLFAPRDFQPAARSGTPEVYLVTDYLRDTIARKRYGLYLPSAFFKRRLQRLPEGGRFAAVMGDSVPGAIDRRVNIGGWQAFRWEEPVAESELRYRLGMGVFLTGIKRNGVVYCYAAKKWGAARAEADVPPPLRTAAPAEFRFSGDAPYGLTGLEIAVGGHRYSSPESGVIFVPLTVNGRPAGPPQFYNGVDLFDNYIYKDPRRGENTP